MSNTSQMLRSESIYPSLELCNTLFAKGLNINPSVSIISGFAFNRPAVLIGNSFIANAKIDAYTYVHRNANIWNTTIGRYCSIGYDVDLSLGDHNYTLGSTSPAFFADNLFKFYTGDYQGTTCEFCESQRSTFYKSVVTIGNDVWIGSRSMFPKSVTVGHGAVIGAGTIVTKDVPPYAVVVNRNGAMQVIKYRFPDEQIADLLELEWWLYDIPRCKNLPKIKIDNVKEFIKFFKNEDPADLPKIDDNWLYFVPSRDQNKCKLFKISADTPITALNI